MNISDKIKNIITEYNHTFKEKSTTILTTCPICNRNDKFSILKANGSCICYHASCSFGRRWFADWLSMVANIERKVAERIIKDNGEQASTKIDLTLKDFFNIEKTYIKDIDIESYNFKQLDNTDGQRYLESRGIPLSIAKKYKIMFAELNRRIIFPIYMNNVCYGWQGRAIDNVESSMKVRNNEGFNRGSLLMFYDNVKNSKHAIICEGPVDAIKFHKLGGNVATMGKVVTIEQIKLINSLKVDKIYLGLDEDAEYEMQELAKKIHKPVYFLRVPKSCKDRCNLINKKADFGECTYDECVEAFNNAVLNDKYLITMTLK